MCFSGILLTDAVLLYYKKAVKATRECADRLSNGDDNKVLIKVESAYPFMIRTTVIDETPAIFQRRDCLLYTSDAADD